jgi:hypothetical protein
MLAAVVMLAWQTLAVRYEYGGNWTSLFCTAQNLTQPPSLAGENLYKVGSSGYDGQFYHYVAHDPLLREGLARYIDAPRLRYRRILMPALAYLAALGQSRFIDGAFVAVNLLFVFAGVYWLARYAGYYAWNSTWGLLFLFVPSVLIALDRLTVDPALTALCVGFALYVTEGKLWKLYVVLSLAPLSRETGFFLPAAYCVSQVIARRAGRAALFATSTVPAIGWYAFVHSRTPAYDVSDWFTSIPLAALLERMIHPVNYPFVPWVRWAATIFDELALAGIVLAFVLCFWPRPAKYPLAIVLAALLMSVTALNLGPRFWSDAFAFGRVFSPLLVLVALRALAMRWCIPALPVALIAPRIGLQLAYNAYRIVQGMFS